MTLHLVRHGRTAANASGLLLGRADPPLDEVGRAQAAALASLVRDPVRVVASPLRRAQETAAAFGHAVEVDERWIELDYGDWDQQPLASVPQETWARWRGDLDLRPPGGETLRELGVRVREACESVAADAARGDVVVVTHVSPLKAALAWALGVGDEIAWRLHVTPASVSRVAIRPHGPTVLSFNEVAHLAQREHVPMTRPDDDLAGLRAAHARLLASIESLTDDDVRAPSLLPGWSRGHVLTHLARNADSMVRMTEAAARGQVVWQYEEGQREREIEEGAGRPARDLVDDVRRTAAAVESTWASTTDDTWANGRARARAGDRAVAHLPLLRWREVELHHADLGLSTYGYADMDPAYIAREEHDVVPPRFGGRTREG